MKWWIIPLLFTPLLLMGCDVDIAKITKNPVVMIILLAVFVFYGLKRKRG